MKARVVETPVPVKPNVEPDVLTSIEGWTLEDQHVYVHCYFKNEQEEMLIRVWRSTFLIDRASGSRSELIHAENISFAPQWTIIRGKIIFSFLLIFSALPKDCKVFDLVEDIPQAGGFHISGIKRNELDVYHVDIL
ncbi:MAG: hypothetical protein JNJ65_16860 [Cyclobacteriaceae bacterium]|jgi:hypothetical protein|nr:hypothetical protein [Cyclobacteriaceae bacterium]